MPPVKATEARGHPTGWRRWLFRVAALVLGPAVFFILLELGLRLFGYGYPTTFFLRRTAPGRPPVYIENVDFGRRFFPAGLVRKPGTTSFPVAKTTGTVRVFVLGESAAMGFPDPSTSFARILEVLLRDRFPTTPFEFINTAHTAINSHAVLAIAGECAALQPDFFIVHLGNNEVVGAFGAAGVLGDYTASLPLVRANLYAKQFRSGQLFNNLVESIKPAQGRPTWRGMATFAESRVSADDARLEGTYSNFRQNLCDICRLGTRAGAKVLVCTIPVNLKDCPPFASMHGDGLTAEQTAVWETAYRDGAALEKAGRLADALAHYAEADRIDPRFAELAFRQARCLTGLGQAEQARMAYLRARDLDALRFRTDTTLNEIIRDQVRQAAADDIHLVDAEQDFGAASPGGAPGEELFFEHVHMNFKGNYLLAASLFRALAPMLQPEGPFDQPLLTEALCAERLAHGEWNRWRVEASIGQLIADQPFSQRLDNAEAVQRWDARVTQRLQQARAARLMEAALYEKALAGAPDDWRIRENYARFLAEDDPARAIEQLDLVLRQVPHHYSASIALGNLLLAVGAIERARARFEAALQYTPEDWNVHKGLASVLMSQGKTEEAIAYLEGKVRRLPDRADNLAQLAGLLLSVNRRELAKARLAEAFQLEPDNAGAHLTMAHVLAAEGATKEANTHLDAALQARPSFLPEVTKLRAQLRKEPAARQPSIPQ